MDQKSFKIFLILDYFLKNGSCTCQELTGSPKYVIMKKQSFGDIVFLGGFWV